jgi:phosphoribosyl 1,2-cyclic phosphodiesterase
MKVRFWGARGSIPTPLTEAELRDKIKFALQGAVGVDLTDHGAIERYVDRLPSGVCSTAGGNTACVEVRAGNSLFILDCGSGMRPLGQHLMKDSFGQGKGEANILVTHTHWDHVQGFPFFSPAYKRGNVLHFYSPFADLRQRFEDQQRDVYYPVPIDYMQATQTWEVLDPNATYEIDGVQIQLALLSHPGTAYAYRFTYRGKVFVFATDGEYHRMDTNSTAHYVEFFRDADLLVFDAQYNFEQAIDEKRDWGHSTPKMGAEFAFRAGVKRLALFHHDPLSSDELLWGAVDEAYHHLAFRSRGARQGHEVMTQVLLAREGLTVDLEKPYQDSSS